jgi:hypothetical protein
MINLNFWKKVNLDGPIIKPELGPCWLWIGFKDKDGYGKFGINRVNDRRCPMAHRYAWEQFFGEPPTLELDHLCRTKSCVNPWHCEDVTTKVNVHRNESPAGINFRKVLCKRGHEITGVRKDRPGHRFCKVCNNPKVYKAQN